MKRPLTPRLAVPPLPWGEGKRFINFQMTALILTFVVEPRPGQGKPSPYRHNVA